MQLQRVFTNQSAPFALQNGTPTIATITVPNDGSNHLVLVAATVNVTSTETAGAIALTMAAPSLDASVVETMDGGGHPAGSYAVGATDGGTGFQLTAPPGAIITVAQSSALTGGAATLTLEVWMNE